MKQISYIDDILDSVVSKNNFRYSKEQLKEAVKVYFNFLVEETKSDEVYAMKIPYIGHLYKNYRLANNKTNSEKIDSKERLDAKQELLEFRYYIDESCGFKAHDYLPYSFEYYKSLKDSYEIKEPFRTAKQSLEILTIVENIQNKTAKNKCKTK